MEAVLALDEALGIPVCAWVGVGGRCPPRKNEILKQTHSPLPSLAIGSIGPSPSAIFTKSPWSRAETALLSLSQTSELQRGTAGAGHAGGREKHFKDMEEIANLFHWRM